MYEYFEGRFIEINPAFIVVDCQGVGYYLHISLNTYTKLKDRTQGRVLVHFVVREDAQLLYGFAEESERRLFRLLISVSGIGSNTARLILSSMSPIEVKQSIAGRDASSLQKVKGIGAKSAQRIVIDLADKIDKEEILDHIPFAVNNTVRAEALSALVMLGFQKSIVEKTLERLLKTEDKPVNVEDLVKRALKIL
ncbi:MAG: Holliday junction branch migration protein RuvA [Bacteroidota bacterium]|nr:Holliday junction branch migration protein RuvA [Bacteroidota bacterium]